MGIKYKALYECETYTLQGGGAKKIGGLRNVMLYKIKNKALN